jgi:hypothetical protein
MVDVEAMQAEIERLRKTCEYLQDHVQKKEKVKVYFNSRDINLYFYKRDETDPATALCYILDILQSKRNGKYSWLYDLFEGDIKNAPIRIYQRDDRPFLIFDKPGSKIRDTGQKFEKICNDIVMESALEAWHDHAGRFILRDLNSEPCEEELERLYTSGCMDINGLIMKYRSLEPTAGHLRSLQKFFSKVDED